MAQISGCCEFEKSHRAIKQAHQITSHYPVLQSTGCSTQFCEGARMISSNEPRVGKDRPVSIVREEAVDFLRQLRRDGIITSDEALQNRINEVLSEIDTASSEPLLMVPENDRAKCPVGGPWFQKQEELEHGLRLAWKHSRRCIMRSQYQDLRLCDLRHVRTSAEMGIKMIQEAHKAFNGGDILPTVFVFPPRGIYKAGPMVWNMQMLSFAGDDGTILGDPINVELTEAIIQLGWSPPLLRTKWDILPLVTKAEGDDPAITEIPKNLFPLVEISHPYYGLAFEKLGLRWVPAPALSRFGFDIGGVQYTAAPFLGWFMDAEIGLRNLVDRERYDVLPSVIESLGWVDSIDKFHEAREVDKLRLLANAQSELNYAVYHSFQQAGVRISDTMTASAMYCNFDDEHFRKHGFRLPADPYWLAPPQGSIVPLWHRGGSPNYQPKPLIARNFRDPIKAWRRSTTFERATPTASCPRLGSHAMLPKQDVTTIHIYYCSSGTTAQKLAHRTKASLSRLSKGLQQYRVSSTKPLNSFSPLDLRVTDIVLLIISSSGHGEVPANGEEFVRLVSKAHVLPDVEWAIFGNGNSTYTDSYNGAAEKLETLLLRRKSRFILPGVFNGDTMVQDPPWSHLDQWLKEVSTRLLVASDPQDTRSEDAYEPSRSHFDAFSPTTIALCTMLSPNIRRLVLEIKKIRFGDSWNAQILVPNHPKDVRRVLSTFRLTGREIISRPASSLTVREILTHFVDFGKPFTHIAWASSAVFSDQEENRLLHTPMKSSIMLLQGVWKVQPDLAIFCSALPFAKPRHYSIASAKDSEREDMVSIEFYVKCHERGRFSQEYLSAAKVGARLRVRLTGHTSLPLTIDSTKSVIAFATGSGIAPIQYMLQQRFKNKLDRPVLSKGLVLESPSVSLFVGFRIEDMQMVSDAFQKAIATNMIDILSLVPSNPDKSRAQDNVFSPKFRQRILSKMMDESCYIFVCASQQAARSFSANMSALLGRDVKSALKERYIEETFGIA